MPDPSSTREPDTRVLVFEVRQGLANRLCAWVAALRLAELYRRELRLVWPVEAACPCRCDELFERTGPVSESVADCLADLGAEPAEVREHSLSNLHDCLLSLDLAAVPQRVLVIRSPFFCHDRCDRSTRAAFAQVDRSWDSEPFADEKTIAVFDAVLGQLRGPMRRLLGRIVPRADILREVETFAASRFRGAVVGVHVRGTDNRRCRGLEALFLDTIARITAVPDGPSVFVASDDRETVARARAPRPEKVVTFATSFDTGGLRQTSMRDALSDMLLLARTERIYKAPFSTFSLVSAALGDVPVTVIHRHWLARLPAAFVRFVSDTIHGTRRRNR